MCGTNSSDLDHAVLLVGYGTEDNTEYFILKNQWGVTWGEQGYMKIINEGTGNGESGMFLQPVIPLSKHSSAGNLIAGFASIIVMSITLFVF